MLYPKPAMPTIQIKTRNSSASALQFSAAFEATCTAGLRAGDFVAANRDRPIGYQAAPKHPHPPPSLLTAMRALVNYHTALPITTQLAISYFSFLSFTPSFPLQIISASWQFVTVILLLVVS
jgi:hypothetical protein